MREPLIADDELAKMIEYAKNYQLGRCMAAQRYGHHVPRLIAALQAKNRIIAADLAELHRYANIVADQHVALSAHRSEVDELTVR